MRSPFRRFDRSHGSRTTVLVLAGLGIALATARGLVAPAPRLVLNGSGSAPVGFYWIAPGPEAGGGLALLRPAGPVRRVLAERGYLPPGIPLLKRIAAGPGDSACRFGDAVFVNGRRVATALAEDGDHRPMPAWSGCRTLGAAEVFVLQDHPRSFDSRYFGPVDEAAILGTATPLWIFHRPSPE